MSLVWWCMPLVPATQEAEARESLEPRRWRLQWAKITPLYSSLARDRLKKKKKKKISAIEKHCFYKIDHIGPGSVAHTCNPNTLGGWGGQVTWVQEFKTSLANMMKPHLY